MTGQEATILNLIDAITMRSWLQLLRSTQPGSYEEAFITAVIAYKEKDHEL